MRKNPLFFDFFGLLSVEVEIDAPFYLPAMALIAKTFSAFACRGRQPAASGLSSRSGTSLPTSSFYTWWTDAIP